MPATSMLSLTAKGTPQSGLATDRTGRAPRPAPAAPPCRRRWMKMPGSSTASMRAKTVVDDGGRRPARRHRPRAGSRCRGGCRSCRLPEDHRPAGPTGSARRSRPSSTPNARCPTALSDDACRRHSRRSRRSACRREPRWSPGRHGGGSGTLAPGPYRRMATDGSSVASRAPASAPSMPSRNGSNARSCQPPSRRPA